MSVYGIVDTGATERGGQVLDIWEGAFMSNFYGTAIESDTGWDIYPEYGEMYSVDAPHPRTEDNWREVDDRLAFVIGFKEA